jgi:ABC-type transport system involved in cytochrome bd biosynthesis fused ATPase/permease subunit
MWIAMTGKQQAGLPADFATPVNTAPVDLAEEAQASAGLWSRLLPALRAFCDGRTAILISHHPIAAELADRVVEVVDGRLVVSTPIAVPA